MNIKYFTSTEQKIINSGGIYVSIDVGAVYKLEYVVNRGWVMSLVCPDNISWVAEDRYYGTIRACIRRQLPGVIPNAKAKTPKMYDTVEDAIQNNIEMFL